VKNLIKFTAAILYFGSLVFSAHAKFSSIYVFGDTLSDTSTNNAGSSGYLYCGKRYTNGRTWVEVLAQRQGLLGSNSIISTNWAFSSNNISFYGQSSAILVTNVANFAAPTNATNCLFVVWVNNADFVLDMNDNAIGNPSSAPNNGTNLANWTTAINLHITNQFKVITNLFAKGCRTLVAPNAADVTTVPQFNSNRSSNYLAFVRQRIITYNTGFTAMLKQINNSPSYAGLMVYSPDIFSLLNSVLTNAASYGLTNALANQGTGAGLQPVSVIGAYSAGALANANLNGPGTNYIFWGDTGDPTAKFHAVIADIVQQMISPVQINGLTQTNGSNRLDVVNMPVGLSGFLDGSTNLAQANWTLVTNISSLNTAQSIFVSTPPLPAGFGSGGLSGSGGSGGSGGPPNPGSGSVTNGSVGTNSFNSAAQFYRLRFPYAWNWP